MIDKKKIIKRKDNPYKNIKTFIRKENYPTSPKIEVKNLSKEFGKTKSRKTVFSNINFEIFENDRVAFLGPNGAGKTTMISILCGYVKKTSGDIKYNFKYSNSPYEKLSVQFQDLQFPNSLTPRDLIEFSIKLANINYEESEKEIFEGISTFEIDSILDKKMSKLSGGQQQRVNVFISLLGKPEVLFLDEYTTGLDIAIKNKIQKYILDFCDRNNISLVIISHDIDCIVEMTNRIIIIGDGRVLIDAYHKDIIKKFGSVTNMLKQYILN